VIAADTTIDGSGQAVTISGNNAVRVFTVSSGVTLNLNSLTVANGFAPEHGYGGGIFNWGGTVIVSNSAVSGNSADHAGGGGIYNYNGTLTVTNSTFSSNQAGAGGGISGYRSTLTVTNSTFSSNQAYGGGGGIDIFADMATITSSAFIDNHGGSSFDPSSGGGLSISGTMNISNSTFSGNGVTCFLTGCSGGAIANGGRLTINNSTFSDNSAESGGAPRTQGGAIDNTGTLTVTTSTFSGNDTCGWGGGIYNHYGSELSVSNSSFSRNSAWSGGGIENDGGLVTVSNSTFSDNGHGGIETSGLWGIVTLKNTIFVVANSAYGPNCTGAITDGGGNLSYPDASCPGINADPLLGPLQDNGGPTWTMALSEGSAAIDAADDAICAAPPVNNLDQRGVARPLGSHCDIGAVEQEPYLKTWFPLMLVQDG
jgi:hypothetical protein